jgi:hypothetical protein
VHSGNQGRGVEITDGSPSNVVEGNLIGTDASGTAALGNARTAVLTANGSEGNVIDGTTAAAGNVIKATGGDGVDINGGSAARLPAKLRLTLAISPTTMRPH